MENTTPSQSETITPKPKGRSLRPKRTSVAPNRGSNAKVKRPRASSRLKELWADPEWRAAHAAKIKAGRKKSKAEGKVITRAGVPDGMRKAEATRRWDIAKEKAEETVAELKKANILGEDDTKAEEALKTALELMRGPSNDKKLKLNAARLVLDFTKSKPASKSIVAVDEAEAWLAEIAEDNADKGEATQDA